MQQCLLRRPSPSSQHVPLPRSVAPPPAGFLQTLRLIAGLLLKLTSSPLKSLTLRVKRQNSVYQERANDRYERCRRLRHGGQKPTRFSHE